MISTVHRIHRRLRSVGLALWGLQSLNIVALTLGISILIAVFIAEGVISGWRGAIIIQMMTGVTVLTIAVPIIMSMIYLSRVSRRVWLAQHMERVDRELNDALLTVISADRDTEIGSPEVIEALRDQVATQLESQSILKWAPISILRPGGFALLTALCLTLGAFALTGSKLSEAYHLMNESPERLSQKLAYTPLIGDIKLTITPPKYTHLPPTFIEGGSGDFEALEGSSVLVQATLSRSATSATLWIERSQVIEGAEDEKEEARVQSIPFTIKERLVSARFKVDQHLKWSVSLTDLKGVEWREAAQRRVVMNVDRPPKIKIITPSSGERVDPAKDLKVSLEAKDDFGIGAASIFVALASDMENSERLDLSGAKGKTWRANDMVDLSVIQAQGGDQIALWVEVSDLRSEPLGPQKSSSEVIYLEVDSPEWAHRELLDALREHLEVQLEALASRLELGYQEAESGPLTLQGLLMRWFSARQKSQLAQEGFDKLVKQLADDELTPREIYLTFTNHLMKLEESLKTEGREMNGELAVDEQSAGQTAQVSSLELNRVEAKSAKVEEVHEGVIIIIEAMVARMALEEMSKLADELKVSRAHIKDLMKMYKDQPSEQLKSQIMRELQRFKQKMKAMREMMAKLQKKLPAEFLNLDGMKSDEVADSLKESESQVNSIEQLLEQGNIEEAMKALDDLSNALEEMSQQLQEDMEELHRQTNPELEKALSELMDSTRDLMKAQEELKQDTSEQQAAIDKAMKKSLENSKAQLEELRSKAQRINDIERDLKLERKGRYIDRVRADARKASDDLQRALKQEMLDEAIDAADRGESEFERLRRLDDTQRYGRRVKTESENQKQLKEASRLSREIKDTLDEIKERLSAQAERAQRQEAQAQTNAREERQRKADAEAQKSKGQPQQGQQGQPQQGQQGQPQQGQQGQPQQGQQGQPKSGSQGRPIPSHQGSPSDELARRQAEISEGLDRLSSRLAEKRDKIPSLNQVPTEPFEQARQGSQEAQQQLKDSRPGRGIDGQQRVSDALKQVMQGLQQAKKPQQGQKPGQQGEQGGQQRQGSKGRSSTEKVEIPEQNGRGPKSMRESLLDAMKSKPARGYDDQVKAYYDSLVR